ncbi:threonine dehydratase, mitochondrial-like, partial [Pogonomyrmex barbatus]|uniref:L-serine deaminase n=1 Tax=Pogonomyrmex barbatus TaxID=144034 RepID=A0A6I9W951_9HYME
ILIEKGLKTIPICENFFSFDKIHTAMYHMKDDITKTPCNQSLRLLANKGFNIYLKKELFQRMNSIKIRGVIYTLLNLPPFYKNTGVVTISRGNLASILCHYGHMLNIPMTVVIPQYMDDERNKLLNQYKDLSINVIAYGRNMLEVHEFAIALAISSKLFYLDLNDHPYMIIGQATMGLEMMRQVHDNIDAVILPTTIDGCNLTAGIALAIKERNSKVQVIEVQVVAIDYWLQKVRSRTTLCNELNFRPVTEYKACALENLPNCLIDEVITIDQTMITDAFECLSKSEGLRDYHAAIALAPILTGQLDKLKGKSVLIPLYGVTDSFIN